MLVLLGGVSWGKALYGAVMQAVSRKVWPFSERISGAGTAQIGWDRCGGLVLGPHRRETGMELLATQSSDWRGAAKRTMAWSGWFGIALCCLAMTGAAMTGWRGAESR